MSSLDQESFISSFPVWMHFITFRSALFPFSADDLQSQLPKKLRSADSGCSGIQSCGPVGSGQQHHPGLGYRGATWCLSACLGSWLTRPLAHVTGHTPAHLVHCSRTRTWLQCSWFIVFLSMNILFLPSSLPALLSGYWYILFHSYISIPEVPCIC